MQVLKLSHGKLLDCVRAAEPVTDVLYDNTSSPPHSSQMSPLTSN